MSTRELATVSNVFAGKEEYHGILTFSLGMDMDGSFQAFGHVVLDEKTLPIVRRELAELFGVESFEAIKGRRCFVLRCFDDWGEMIEGVEVDGKRWTLTGFRRRCYPDKARSVLEVRTEGLHSDIARLARQIAQKNEELASVASRYVDWEKH